MAITKKARPKAPAAATPTSALDLMELQDPRSKGDSKASSTASMAFSTTPEFKTTVQDAAYKLRVPMSHLIEVAVKEYLGLD